MEDIALTSGKLHIVTELCPGGSLLELLINSRVYPSNENSSNYINMASTLNQRQLLKISADIANGMVHLSSQKVCDVFINCCKTKPTIEYCKFSTNMQLAKWPPRRIF